MIRRFSIALFFLTFGLMLTPAVSYACGKDHKKTEKSCAKKESSSKTEKTAKKNGCKEDPCKNEHSSTNDQGCGSNCNHSNCKCIHFTVSIALTEENLLGSTMINFSARKHSPINAENNLSEGFHSIWQPPKIS